jgi:hypothetical protein
MPQPAQPASPPTPPTPPGVPTGVDIQTTGGKVSIALSGGGTPSELYEGAKAARSELADQLDRVKEDRLSIAQRLRDGDNVTGADRAGLEARLANLDARIIKMEGQIELVEAEVVRTAALPGAIVEKPDLPRVPRYDETAAIIVSFFTVFVFAPIAIAYARRIWKRGATVIAPVPREVTDRLEAMGQAVESIAIEVERIGEGQRFITKVMGERQLGQGAAQPVQVPQGERVDARR